MGSDEMSNKFKFNIFTRTFIYGIGLFISGLALFNATKLELRQTTDSNLELLFQNGQIISAFFIFLCVSGIISEMIYLTKVRTTRKIAKKRVNKK